MLDLFSQALLSASFNTILWMYKITYSGGFIFALVAGLLIPTIYFDRPEKDLESDVSIYRICIIGSAILFIFGTLSPIVIPFLAVAFLEGSLPSGMQFSFPIPTLLLIILTIVGMISHIYLRRWLTPKHNELRNKITQKSKLTRDEKTDIRTIRDVLPDGLDYDPEDFFNESKGIFVGLSIERKPIYMPIDVFRKQHGDILGTTGAGKGVASAIILAQAILYGEAVFVGDPKDDEWAPHVFKYACEKAGKPFHLINLRKNEYQLDLLAGISPDELEELLVAGFSLAEKGDVADFYRIGDRKAARVSSSFASDCKTLRELFNTDYVQGIAETEKAFYGKLEELAGMNAINSSNGVRLQEIFDTGGCCYIIGSLRNSKIITAQRMILIRLYQIAEARDRINNIPRPVAILLTEFKYHISKSAMEGLGAIRDKGVHILMDHQSIADLKDCPADLNPEFVVAAVVENSKFKIVYRIQDPDTAEWIARMTGTILVDDETRTIETSKVLTESVTSDRQIRQADRHFVDSNMLLSLKDGTGFIFTSVSLPTQVLISPIKVTKKELTLSIAPPLTDSYTESNELNTLDFDDDFDPEDMDFDEFELEEDK